MARKPPSELGGFLQFEAIAEDAGLDHRR